MVPVEGKHHSYRTLNPSQCPDRDFYSPILSLVLAAPGIVFLKASLLDIDDIPQPKKEDFLHKKPHWIGEVNYL